MTTLHLLRVLLTLSLLLATGASAVAAPESVQSAPGDTLNVELVGHLGGATDGIFVQGNYAYAGFGAEFAVIEASDPAALARVGYILLPDTIQDIVVSANLAFVAAGSAGLRVLDVTNPVEPLEVGAYSQYSFHEPAIDIRALAVAGDLVYLADYASGLRIVDVSDPTQPTLVGSAVVSATAVEVTVAGTIVYLGDELGMGSIDVSDPQHPVEVGRFSSGSDDAYPVYAIEVVAGIAYLAAADGLAIVDVSDPSSPAAMGSFSDLHAGIALAVAPADGEGHRRVYLGTGEKKLRLIDAADPANPRDSIYARLSSAPNSIFISGSYVYVTGIDPSGYYSELQVYSFPSLETLELKSHSETPGTSLSLDVAGDLAYLADGDSGLRVIDVSDPTLPHEIGSYDSGNSTIDVVAGRLNPDGRRYVYVVERMDENCRLVVVEVTNPASPVAAGSFNLWCGSDLFISGDDLHGDQWVYVADYMDGLRILDISDPSHPIQLSLVEGALGTIAVTDADELGRRYAFASGGYGDLKVFDVTDPANPAEVGSFPVFSEELLISGDYLYIDSISDIFVLDISDPTQPAFVSSMQVFSTGLAMSGDRLVTGTTGMTVIDTSDVHNLVEFADYELQSATVVDIKGDTVYMVEPKYDPRYGGLYIMDISGLAPPVWVDQFEPAGIVRGVTVEAAHALTTGNYGNPFFGYTTTTQIMDIANPSMPEVKGALDIPFYNTKIAAQGNYGYVAGVAGLRIFDFSDPASPFLTGAFDEVNPYNNLVVSGNTAYLAGNYANAFVVVDISNPADPQRTGTLYLDVWETSDVAISGNYAYLLTPYMGLQVVDISHPENPVMVGSYQTEPSYYSALAVSTDQPYAYIVDQNQLRILNVSDPLQPVETSVYNLRQVTYLMEKDIVIGGPDEFGRRYAYVANEDAGLEVIDITDPDNPQQAGYYDTPGRATSLALSGDLLYLADNAGGLYVLHFTGYSISGRVKHPNLQPFPGVTLSTDGGYSAESDSSGKYAVEGLPPGDHTLTPALTGYRFEPENRSASLPPNISGAVFTVIALPVSTELSPDLAASLIYTDTQGLPTRVDIPAGAVVEPVTLTITPTLASRLPGSFFTGHAFEMEISPARLQPGSAFNQPVTLTIDYSDYDVWPVVDENLLALSYWDGAGWVEAAETCDPDSPYSRDPASNRLVLQVCQTGLYALFGQTIEMRLPILLVDRTP